MGTKSTVLVVTVCLIALLWVVNSVFGWFNGFIIQFNDWWQQLGEDFSAMLMNLFPELTTFFEDLAQWVYDGLTQVGDALGGVGDGVYSVISGIPIAVGDFIENLQDMFANLWNMMPWN